MCGPNNAMRTEIWNFQKKSRPLTFMIWTHSGGGSKEHEGNLSGTMPLGGLWRRFSLPGTDTSGRFGNPARVVGNARSGLSSKS